MAYCLELSYRMCRTDEMRPAWFSIQRALLPPTNATDPGPSSDPELNALPEIPLRQMWADDEFWMPLMFSRRRFIGRADFSADQKMLKWWFAATPPVSP